jgi:DNA helicase IV
VLAPEQVLSDLYASPERLATAGGGIDLSGLHRAAGSAWTVADAPLLDELAELLGPRPGPTASSSTPDSAYAAEVLSILESADRQIAGEDPDELRPTDFVTADVLAARQVPEHLMSVAERAAADRDWRYGHLVVDEAQELSAMDWHVLLRRCPSGSVTAVGDLAQRSAPAGARTWAEVLAPIAGDRFTLRALTVNYRTPAEIMEAAALALPEDERHRVPQSVRRTGEPPIHARLDELAGLVDGRGTAAVITADPAALPTLDGFVVHSPGSAKGLEFDVVAVVDPEAIRAACPADLYVAMTRATRRLVLVPGAQSSSASIRAAVRAPSVSTET